MVFAAIVMVNKEYQDAIDSNSSEQVLSTTDDTELTQTPHYVPQPGEIIIVVCIVIGWIIAVTIFLKRWASIRISRPMESRYHHSPKNLENIKVVKRAQDSVIYKNYGRKMSVTIVEREKKTFQRMHTIAALPSVEMEPITEL